MVDELGTQCSKQELQLTQTHLSTPRQEAGGPSANDTVACRLRPLTATDLGLSPVPFTAGQKARLRALFATACATGACPVGEGERRTVPWLRYDAAGGGAAYGSRRLPDAPRGSGGGLSSRSFAAMIRG